jgi:hypothetical protein
MINKTNPNNPKATPNGRRRSVLLPPGALEEVERAESNCAFFGVVGMSCEDVGSVGVPAVVTGSESPPVNVVVVAASSVFAGSSAVAVGVSSALDVEDDLDLVIVIVLVAVLWSLVVEVEVEVARLSSSEHFSGKEQASYAQHPLNFGLSHTHHNLLLGHWVESCRFLRMQPLTIVTRRKQWHRIRCGDECDSGRDEGNERVGWDGMGRRMLMEGWSARGMKGMKERRSGQTNKGKGSNKVSPQSLEVNRYIGKTRD